jgi:hypothetical protein
MRRLSPILLLLFVSGSALASPRPEYCRELLEQFREIVLLTEKPFSEVRLPNQIFMNVGRGDFELGFKLYRKYWEKGFDRTRFLSIVDTLADGKQMSPEEVLWLKGLRGRIKRLRNTYVAFDKEHEFPSVIKEVSVRIGHIQDGINNANPAYTLKEAKRFRDYFTSSIERKFQKEIEDFVPAKRENFRRWVDSEVDELDYFLKKGGVTSLEFHESRKTISHFAALFDAFTALDNSADNQLMIDYLGSLNEEMGIFHDDLVSERLAGKIDYNHDQFAFPVPIRDALTQLADRFRHMIWK